MNFLVSGAAADIGQSITSILNSVYRDASVFGCDIHVEYLAQDLYREIAILPPASSQDYFDCLSSLIEKYAIDVFIPTSEAELRLFAHKQSLLTEHLSCHCLMASYKAMNIGFDKLDTVNHLHNHSLPAPWAVLASDTESGAPEIPCILKSRTGSGNSSVYFIDDYDKSLHLQKIFPDYIWQQYLPLSKGEYTCGVYRCLDSSTRVIVLRRRLSSGVTSFAEVVKEPDIDSLCVSIADSLELQGSINIQLRYVDKVGPMVFEINPRFSSTVGMRHKIGFSDLIWSIEEQVFGTVLSPCTQPWPAVRMGRRYQELISHRVLN